MAVTRYRAEGVTVTLNGDLSARLRALVDLALPGALEAMEAAIEPIAAHARAEWYGDRGVNRETGQSGDIAVVSTVDVNRGELRVSVGSTDPRRVGSKPLVVYVHSPTVTGVEYRTVTVDEYWRTPKGLRGPFSLDHIRDLKMRERFARYSFPLILQSKSGAGTGHGQLLETLVKKSARNALKAGPALAAIARAITSHGGGRG